MAGDLEERVTDLERRLARLEPHVEALMPIGPINPHHPEISQDIKKIVDEAARHLREKVASPVDRSAQQLISGAFVPEDHSHTRLKSNGQQQDYVVLTPEERAKGFVRPVRRSYRHVGPSGPKHPLRGLTPDEQERWGYLYAQFEQYPGEATIFNGRFWTQEQLDAVGKGCGTVTTMGHAIAETYARDPKFYGGTFCCGCGKHLPIDEFVWDGTEERVGS